MPNLVDNAAADLGTVFFNTSDFAEQVTWTHGGVSKKINVIWFEKAAISEFAGIDANNAEPFLICKADDVDGIDREDSIVRLKDNSTVYVTSVREEADGQHVVFFSQDNPNG